MPKRKSRVFVGSSSEAWETASAFAHKLSDHANAVLWRDALEFRASKSTMENLFQATARYDYGFFIFTPDDRYQSRGEEGTMGRDNVLFEFGLFLGTLGSERAFGVVQLGKTPEENLKTPSDLWGIQMPRFTCDSDMVSEVARATYQITEQIKRLGPRPLPLDAITRWGFDSNTEDFTLSLDRGALAKFKEQLKDMKFAVVVRKRDTTINNHQDPKIAVSTARGLPHPLNSDMDFSVETAGKIQPVSVGDMVEGYLLLVPPGCDTESAKTMEAMYGIGCEPLGHVSRKVDRKKTQHKGAKA